MKKNNIITKIKKREGIKTIWEFYEKTDSILLLNKKIYEKNNDMWICEEEIEYKIVFLEDRTKICVNSDMDIYYMTPSEFVEVGSMLDKFIKKGLLHTQCMF